MRNIDALLFLSIAAGYASAADPQRPRGVGPDFAKFYKSADSFTCISNPSVQLSLSQVNDNYCDCPDGSDEPGTSACSFLSPLSPESPLLAGDNESKPVLPGFYCKNKGHRPGYIPFMNVNDGVCDYDLCCDGSDEWEKVGGVKCEDKCKEIGKEWRKQDEQRQKSVAAASKRRKELVDEAAKLRKEVEDQIANLQIQIKAQEVKVADLEQEEATLEKSEKNRVVKSSGKGGKIGVLSTLAKAKLDEYRKAVVLTRGQRDALFNEVVELEKILTKFKSEYNPNFNDEGVKRAVRAWEDYAAKDRSEFDFEEGNSDLDAIENDDDAINWEEYEESDQISEDIAALYQFEEYLPHSIRAWLDQKLREARAFLVSNGILAELTETPRAPSKKLTDAQARTHSARSDLESQKRNLREHEEDLQQDYGVDEVFRSLKGKCTFFESGEYRYELCWMKNTKQKSKKGGASTSLGDFTRFEKIMVDDAKKADGTGLGSGERIALKFENGQHCWNGPARSTTVVLACYEKEEIWRVAEEEKCVYRMEVGTPAACDFGGANGSAGKASKDEL